MFDTAGCTLCGEHAAARAAVALQSGTAIGTAVHVRIHVFVQAITRVTHVWAAATNK